MESILSRFSGWGGCETCGAVMNAALASKSILALLLLPAEGGVEDKETVEAAAASLEASLEALAEPSAPPQGLTRPP